MNRSFTNIIRFLIDNILPPIVRDNKYFVYPLFVLWFGGKNLRTIMNFKCLYRAMSQTDLETLYEQLDTRATRRPSDLTGASLEYILESLDKTAKSLLDVGCGRGFFMKKALERGYDVTGCDFSTNFSLGGCKYHKANAEKLPFADNQFDIVVCNHTLEHIRNLDAAIAELKRVANTQLIISVPCQRYFYYTFDLHIHFFPKKCFLEQLVDMEYSSCKKIWGDLVYIGFKKK